MSLAGGTAARPTCGLQETILFPLCSRFPCSEEVGSMHELFICVKTQRGGDTHPEHAVYQLSAPPPKKQTNCWLQRLTAIFLPLYAKNNNNPFLPFNHPKPPFCPIPPSLSSSLLPPPSVPSLSQFFHFLRQDPPPLDATALLPPSSRSSKCLQLEKSSWSVRVLETNAVFFFFLPLGSLSEISAREIIREFLAGKVSKMLSVTEGKARRLDTGVWNWERFSEA